MLFLFNTCQHPDILRILYFVYLLLDIVFIVVPIGLIVMLMIDFSKAVISTKTDDMVKSTKLVTKRIIYAVIIFIIPWIVSVLTIFIDTVGLDLGGDYKECIINVNKIKNGILDFEYFDELYELIENEVIDLKPACYEEQASGDLQWGLNPGSGWSKINKSKEECNNGSIAGGASSEDKYKKAADDLINLAKGEKDKTERTRYGGPSNLDWCGYFVTWTLKNTEIAGVGTSSMSLYDYINKDGYNLSDGAASGLRPPFDESSHLDFYKSTEYGGTYTPKKGDIVWFQYGPDNRNNFCYRNYGRWDGVRRCADHVGLVEYFDGEYVHTIEGNHGGKVALVTRNVKDIIAYGSWYK